MAMPSVQVKLFDATGPANTDFDTGVLDVRGYDAIWTQVRGVGGALAAVANTYYWNDGTDQLVSTGNLTAAFAVAFGGWGLGVGTGLGGGLVVSHVLPDKIKYKVAALGVGVAARITIWGRRNHRGPDVSGTPD